MTVTFQSAVFAADDTLTITLSNENFPAGTTHKHDTPLLCVGL
jgi:hypothetical protein